MSAVTARPIGAAGAVQPTAAGERALRRALGYIAQAGEVRARISAMVSATA